MVFVTPLASPPPVIALVPPSAPQEMVNPWVQTLETPAAESDILLAQAVIPEGQTNVSSTDDQITISGGEQAGANLFYEFEQFNVPTEATADFLSNSTVQRVIGHVTGGNSSNIDGLLTVTGSSADLFIINPAGILFGPNTRLDLPAAFTATTAQGISFGDRWFNTTGNNAIQELSGDLNGLAFAETSGAIVNLADLSTDNNLTLAAGTVVDLGSLSATNGTVQVLSQTSGTVVLQDGLLRLDLVSDAWSDALGGTTVSLAELLTGGTTDQAAAITVDSQGNVFLADTPITPGDSVISQINGQAALVAAEGTLYLPSSHVNTAEALTLVGEQIYANNSESHPLILNAGERLTIQGNEGINILALYNAQTAIAGGDVILASDGEISLDTHISSLGDVRFTTLDQRSANFISLYDPIISADGDVSFGEYEGPALKVEATGSILINGDITISGPDITLTADGSGSDEDLLASSPALILRAGETVLENPANIPQLGVPALNTDFVEATVDDNPPSITVNGDIYTNDTSFIEPGGPVILTAPGVITLNGDVNTRSNVSGDIVIEGGEIFARSLISNAAFSDTSSINLTATTGDIIVETISAGSGGIDINAAGFFQATDTFDAFVRITLDLVEDAELIAFLRDVDEDAFNQIDLNEQIEIQIPTSVATSPDSGDGPIRIRHGAGGSLSSGGGDYDIQGTEAVSLTPFFAGPNTDNVTITINPGGSSFQATVSGFTPLFTAAEFPTDASGTNGAIAQLQGDGSLATAFFNEPFVPVVPPEPPVTEPPTQSPTQPPVTESPEPLPVVQSPDPSEPDFTATDTDNLDESSQEETATTDNDTGTLLALRGPEEDECNADEITEDDGVIQLSGDCLEETRTPEQQSTIPIDYRPKGQPARIDNVRIESLSVEP